MADIHQQEDKKESDSKMTWKQKQESMKFRFQTNGNWFCKLTHTCKGNPKMLKKEEECRSIALL